MTRLAIAAAIALLMLALGLGNYLQHQQLQNLRERTAIAEQTARNNLAIIDTLEQHATAQRASLQALNRTQNSLREALSLREITIKQLERDNENYRHWAAVELPDAAARLRQRPAITGANAYRQFLSGPEPVPAAAHSAAEKRRPDG